MGVYLPRNRLPSAYQEVEWIEPSGQGPYIDTGLAVSNQLAFDFNITPNSSYVSEHSILGNIWNSNALFFLFYNGGYNLNNGGTSYNGPTASTNKTRITVDKNGFSINGVSYSCVSGNNYGSGNVWIYAVNSNYGNTRRGVFKLYNMEITQNGTLVRNMIPCYRKSDSVIGLYDLVNSVFYTNQGTGTFTKGSDVYMSELKNAYIGEVWTPGANTLLYYDFENDSGTTVTNKGTWGSTMSGTATGVTFQTLSSGKKVAEITSSSRTYGIISNGTGTIPSNLTMFVWLKSSSNNNNRSGTFGWNGTNVDIGLGFNADGGRTNFMSYVNGWNFYGKNGTVTTDGTWHLLVATCGGNDGNKLYLDGTLLSMAYSQGSASSTIGTATTNVKVGMSNNSSQDRSFAGQIGCFGVENKIWSSDEITAYHNLTKSQYGIL